MEEVSLLLYINKYVRENAYDTIILDCAPTGESLRFISIPTTLEWYMKKLFKMERTLVKVARPVAKKIYDLPLPGDDYFQGIEDLFKRLRGIDQILADDSITTVRLVTNPEKIVLKETQRAFMYFSLYKMNIDAIIMNRILPDNLKEAYFKDWISGQKKHIERAREYFSPVPIFPVNQFSGEIIGYRSLKTLADKIYGKKNPLKRFYTDKPYQITKKNGEYKLTMRLPFVSKENIELSKFSDELIVRIGGFKRHILLPRKMAALKSIKAKTEGSYLQILFSRSRS